MTIQTYITKIPKLFINIKHWLFSDLKQSVALIDQYNLFEDLDIRNLKVNKPPSKEIYSKCFKISNKLCLLPTVMLIAEQVVGVAWARLTGYCVGEYPIIACGLIPFAGILYGVLIWLISFIIAWKYNFIMMSLCPNLK